ncbi:M48 family metallopeptidase [Thiothrix subterranea]|uniref:SprT family zinc-dependent metalloprotease n=1 Tax=Thiothrix subterranea TaxID=2735563 RepID=A0AA51QZK3_9GAMM|nr:SprT family zinc-dependent metalloprotease [Thiothrix subterranea]MDQ5769513.1 SprT family zinc-dependent metalloprotease [Thiothrix subterranea]WML87097.1 SprT family zinc-dependent metalloprotease [Thiothrix subterranea]
MGRLTLVDGRVLDYQVRQSARAKYMRMNLSADKGLVVTQPVGVGEQQLRDWIHGKLDWITDNLPKVERYTAPLMDAPALPEYLEFPVTGERFRLVYTPTSRHNIAADIGDDGTLTLSGAVGNPEHCRYVLREWTKNYARYHLGQMLQQLATQTGLGYVSYSVKGQETRWGSCSTRGNINLNYKLVLLPVEWVRYTLIHELCHTVEMNHSTRFWALVAKFAPDYKAIHAQMKGAMQYLPDWTKGG